MRLAVGGSLRLTDVKLTKPTQVTLTEWLKAVGNTVAEGEVIVELMTDKAAFEDESPAAGTLSEILVEPDEEIAVGSVLGRIDG